MVAFVALLIFILSIVNFWIAIDRRRFYVFPLTLLTYYTLLIFYHNKNWFDGTGAIFFILTCTLLFLISIIVFESLSNYKNKKGYVFFKHKNSNSILLFSIFAVVLILLFLLSGQNLFSSVWERRSSGSSSLASTAIPYIVILLLACWSTLPAKVKMLALPIIFFAFALSGNRAIFSALLIWPVFVFFKKAKWWAIPTLGLFGVAAAFVLFYVLRIVRSVGVAAVLNWDWLLIETAIWENINEGSLPEASIAMSYLFAYNAVVSSVWEPALSTLRRIGFVVIPSSSQLGFLKPGDITFDLWALQVQSGFYAESQFRQYFDEQLRLGILGSAHPTIWGDAVLNLGWWSALLWPPALAFLLTRWDSGYQNGVRYLDSRICMGIWIPSMIYLVRGNVSIAVTYLVVCFIMYYSLARLLNLRAERCNTL